MSTSSLSGIKLFWMILPIALLIRGITCLKEESRDKFCTVLFIIFCSIWTLSRLIFLLIEQLSPGNAELISLFLVLFTLLNVSCFLGSLAALIRYNSDKYSDGRKQASAVLILSLIFTSVMTFQYKSLEKITAIETAGINETLKLEYKEKNYRFTLPENSNYRKLAASSFVNEEADFILRDRSSQFFFLVISENAGEIEGVTKEDYIEAVKDNMKEAADYMKVKERTLTEIDRITADRLAFSAKIKNLKFNYDVRILMNKGAVYQLMTYTLSRNGFDKLKEEADYLAQKFQILGKEKITYAEGIEKIENFYSSTSPFSLEFGDKSSWFKWADFKIDCPESEYGGHTADGSVQFCVNSIVLDDKEYSDELLANTLIDDFDLKLSDKAFSIVKKRETKPYRSYELKATRNVEGSNYDYYFDIYFTENSAFSFNCWGPSNDKKTAKALEDLRAALKFVTIDKPLTMEKLPESFKKTQSHLWSSVGGVYYRQEKYQEAATCFLRAYDFNKGREVTVTDYFWCMSNTEEFDKILDFLKDKPHLEKNMDILGWKAFALKQTNQLDEAVKTYFALFKNEDYENEGDFIDFVSLLASRDKFDDIHTLSTNYLKKERNQPSYHRLCNILINYEKFTEAENILKNLPEKYSNSIETKRLTLRFYIKSGDYKKADSYFASLLEEGYRDRTTLYTGAKLYFDIGWYHKAKETLQQVLKIAPNDEDAKELMSSTLGYLGEGDKGNTVEPIEAVPMTEELISKIKDLKKPGSESDLHYSYFVTCYSFENGMVKKTTYKKFALNTSTGVKDYATMFYTYNPSSSSIYVNKLEVTPPNDPKKFHSDRNAFYLKDADDDQATEDKTLCMPVSSLQPGCTVEYIITEKYLAKYDYFPFEREWLCLTVPYGLSAVTVSGDIDKIAFELVNSTHKPEFSEKSITFFQPGDIVYKSEPEDPPAEYSYPLLILGSSTLSWEQEAENYLKKIQPKLTPSETLHELVSKTTKGCKTDTEKVRALISYIQDNITYQAIEFGQRGIIPDTPMKVLKQKYGDCKDMSVLLYQMLLSLNIKSTLVLVATNYRVYDKTPSMDQFNHMILYIDSLDKFVDCTVKYCDLLTVGNTSMHSKKVLLMEPGKAYFKTIPYYETQKESVNIHRKFKLLEKDELQVTEQVVFNGYYAYFMRRAIITTKIEDRSDKVKGYINYWPELEAFNLKISNLEDYSKDLIFDMTYTVKKAVKTVSNEKSLDLETPWTDFYLIVTKSEERKNPFKIYYNMKFVSKIEFESLPGIKLKAESIDKSYKQPFFEGSVKSTVSDSRLTIKSTCQLNRGTYSAEKYQDYYKSVSDFMNNALGHLKLVKSK